jgi:gluconokinase
MQELILAVDIGTSAVKAVLFDVNLRQVAIARHTYPILTPNENWSEQAPDVIMNAVLQAMRESITAGPEGGRLLAVSFSSQLYSVLALSADGRPLTNSIIWSDTRSASIAQRIRQHPVAQEVYRRTGCPIDAIYPLSKIQWLKETQNLPSDVKFISIKEYVLYRLTGQLVADWSLASATGLLEIDTHQWAPMALELLGILPRHLSELAAPRTVFTEWKADRVGLLSGTPLVIGAGDGPLASLGVGAFTPEVAAVNVGTSAAARVVISQPTVDPSGRLWTYVVDENVWVLGGMVSSGGIMYEWFLQNFIAGLEEVVKSGESPHHYAERIAAVVPPGAEGLLFVPYLSGEQCPVWHPYTRGSFFGLELRHQRGHLARAVMEGVTYSIYRIVENLRPVLPEAIREVRVTGGLTASPLWLQIAADMLGLPIAVPESAEGSARGAAMLALMALGIKSNLESFTGLFPTRERVLPRHGAHAVYEKHYQRFLTFLDLTRHISHQEV